jgi:protein-disulfide isomerase
MAKDLGLDIPKLDACMKSAEAEMAIQSDIAEAASLGIDGTPTFFMNGRRIEGVMPMPVWDRLIDMLLHH